MPKGKKVKRYYSIYSKKRQRKRLALQIVIAIVIFVFLVVAVFFVARGITWLNRQSQQSSQSAQEISMESSDTSAASSEQSAVPQNSQLQARQMSVTAAKNASKAVAFIQQAKADGCNAVVVPMKTEDGVILYKSSVPEVAQWKTQEASVDAAVIISEIEQQGMTPIAQIYAFTDSTAAHASRDNTYYYRNDTSTTRKFDGKRYLNPYKVKARTYICDIVKELGAMGFSQVLLDGVQFPSVQLTVSIGTGSNGVSKSDIMKQFISELNSTGVSTILSYEWSAIGGGDTADLLYGGDPASYEAKSLAPIISLSNLPSQVSGTQDDIVSNAMQQILQSASDVALVPEVPLGNTAQQIEQQLVAGGVSSYIEVPAE